MKFIFPQNYNFKPKLLGFIEYPVAIINVLLWLILLIRIRDFKNFFSFIFHSC